MFLLRVNVLEYSPKLTRAHGERGIAGCQEKPRWLGTIVLIHFDDVFLICSTI
jgi:hypothetical protein